MVENEVKELEKVYRKNFFHQPIPEISDILKDGIINTYIKITLGKVLEELGIENRAKIIDEVIELAGNYDAIKDGTLHVWSPVQRETNYEKPAHEILVREGVTQIIPEKLANRAHLMFSQIQDYLLPGSVLDMGCGDGKLGAVVASEGYKVTLADVYEHGNIKLLESQVEGLDFILFGQKESLPLINREYDNALLLTVNHHSINPMHTTLDTMRLVKKGGRILVIESVYGIEKEQKEDIDYGTKSRKMGSNFKALDHRRQMLANVFFDHFYNRVIHYSDDPNKKVPVPFNFCTTPGWKMFFNSLGLEQEKVVYLGNDQLTVPEYHTLHVLNKIA
jgi:2-polyprenyl-3-methyl-5-hydroxy-6-metoxy-1,4-benzoquinol methylase